MIKRMVIKTAVSFRSLQNHQVQKDISTHNHEIITSHKKSHF